MKNERRRKAGLDAEEADEEESDDAEMNEQNYRRQPEDIPAYPHLREGDDEVSDNELVE